VSFFAGPTQFMGLNYGLGYQAFIELTVKSKGAENIAVITS
jgi:hypothetical protein